MTLPPDAVMKLHMALPASRVHKRVGGGGKSLDYIAAHDAIRTANAIFGFGEWGSVVTDLTCVGQEQVVSRDGNKKGYRVGYRCTVLLTVRGCEPTSGVGYGDSMEYNDSSITPHENAAKEAESDALKRALKNYGDQFGLILYAGQGEERARVEREAAIRRQRALSSAGGPKAASEPVSAAEANEPPSPAVTASGGESGETHAAPSRAASGGADTSPAPPETSRFQSPDARNQPCSTFPAGTTQAKTLKKLDVTVVKGRDNVWWTTEDVYALARDVAPDIVKPDAFYLGDDGRLHYSDLRTVLPLWACSQLIDALTAQGELAAARSAA